MPTRRSKRSVADIFDDLDNIGKVMPAFSETTLAAHDDDNDDDNVEDLRAEASSVPTKRSRLESDDGAVSEVRASGAAVSKQFHRSTSALGSKRGGSCSPPPSITIGSPFSPEMDREDSSSSSAFASELTTRHRKAEEQADTAMFLAESLHQCPTSDALKQLVDHFDACGSVQLLRTIRTTGTLPSFLRAILSDSKYASIRSANYALQYLRFLGHLTNLLPHDLLPVGIFFSRLVWFVNRAVSSLPRQQSCSDDKPLSPPAHPSSETSVVPEAGPQTKKARGGLAAAVASRVATNPSLRPPAPSASESSAKSSHRSTPGEHDLSVSVENLLARDQSGSGSSNAASMPSDPSSDSVVFVARISSTATPQDDKQTGHLAVAHLAVDAATRLLLEHNTLLVGREATANGFPWNPSLSNLLSKSAAVLFAEVGGLHAMRCLLRDVREDRRLPQTNSLVLASLKLVTLVTCDAELAKLVRSNPVVSTNGNAVNHSRVIQQLLGECGDWIRVFHEASSSVAGSTGKCLPRDELLEVTRSLINMTSILPSECREQDPRAHIILHSLARWIRHSVEELDAVAHDKATSSLDVEPDSATADVMETGTLCICLAINLVRRGECVDAVAELTRLGPHQEEEVLGSSFLSQCARLLVRWHEATDSQRSVVAGYLSMLLGCVSLCPSSQCDYRVAVITAISRAIGHSARVSSSAAASSARGAHAVDAHRLGVRCNSQPTTKDVQVKRKPMSLVVAVLQEFILFQSSAGILSRDVLIEMHQAVERIIASNEIDVTAATTTESGLDAL